MAFSNIFATVSASSVSEKVFGISPDIFVSSFVTISITILGFVITYFMTRKSMKDEILKFKQTSQVNLIQTLPFELCDLMYKMKDRGTDRKLQDKYAEIMNKVVAYGSKNAVKIAAWGQQVNCKLQREGTARDFRPLVALGLLISQLKYDFSAEEISAESWFILRFNDYPADESQKAIKALIDKTISVLDLNPNFSCKRTKTEEPTI